MTAIEAASTEEIDALLAQADSLMADMADSLGEQRPQQSDSPSADKPMAARAGAGQADVAEAVTEEPQTSGESSVEPPESSGEPSAKPPEPSGEASPDQAETRSERASAPEAPELEAAELAGGDGDKPAVQPEASDAEGPQSPPPDWLAEADINNLAENVKESLPHIPETLTSEEAPARERSASRPAGAARILPRAAAAVAHVPIDLLILLDRPFSRLSAGTKACLGYAAIGTLIVGIATWLLSNAQAAN